MTGTFTGTVLVVDDEETMRDSCLQVLGREGYEVVLAADGQTALEAVRRHRPDLALVDLKMLGMSGLEFLAHLRQEAPETVAVVITGYATLEVAVQAVKDGAYDVLAKPFTPEELRLMARRGLDRHRLTVRLAALERDKENMRDKFAAMISHQLRSPLVAVAQHLEVLRHGLAGDLPPKARQAVERMNVRVSDLLELIDDWTLLSGTERVRLSDAAREVDLVGLVREVVGREVAAVGAKQAQGPHGTSESEPAEAGWQATAAGVRHASVAVEVPSQALSVRGEPRLLSEMVGNLVSNALKYTPPEGRVTVRVDTDGSTALVTVTDTGIGIPEDEQPFLFEDFFRGAEAKKRGGTGLGLVIAKRVAQLHGGSISVTSEVGLGSTFTVRLPLGSKGSGTLPVTRGPVFAPGQPADEEDHG